MLLSICLLAGSNGPKFEATLAHLFSLFGGYRSVELIVSDSSSSGLVENCCGSYPEVVYLENHGASYGENVEFAVSASRGHYVWLLACGDKIEGDPALLVSQLSDKSQPCLLVKTSGDLSGSSSKVLYGFKVSQLIFSRSSFKTDVFTGLRSVLIEGGYWDWFHMIYFISAISQFESHGQDLQVLEAPIILTIKRSSNAWWTQSAHTFLRVSLELRLLERDCSRLLSEFALPLTSDLISRSTKHHPPLIEIVLRSFSYSSTINSVENERSSILFKKYSKVGSYFYRLANHVLIWKLMRLLRLMVSR